MLKDYKPTAKQRRLLARVAKAALKRGALDMGQWHTCKTTHCIAGWVCVLDADARREEGGNSCHTHYAASCALGLTFQVNSYELFLTNESAARRWLRQWLRK